MFNIFKNPDMSRREFGQGIIEYAFVVAGVSILSAAAIVPVTNATAKELDKATEAITGVTEEETTDWSIPAYAMLYTDGSLIFQRGTDTAPNKTLLGSYSDFETDHYTSAEQVPWYSHISDIKSINFVDGIKPVSTAFWFAMCMNCTEIDFKKLITDNVVDMNSMFMFCYNLTALDLSSFNTPNVTDMTWMFSNCSKLETVVLGSGFNFVGSEGYLPTPRKEYISGADGKWYNLKGVGFAPNEIPSNTADTYQAVK